MDELDKAALGERVRRIRTEAGLRQWELARRLGTTQSAVHKYEHGVVPEPRRLIELARIGETSVEWILTGRHWENGSEEKVRVSADLLATAWALKRLNEGDRNSLARALRIVRAAAEAAAPESETLPLLEAAAGIQEAVHRSLAEAEREHLENSPLLRDRKA